MDFAELAIPLLAFLGFYAVIGTRKRLPLAGVTALLFASGIIAGKTIPLVNSLGIGTLFRIPATAPSFLINCLSALALFFIALDLPRPRKPFFKPTSVSVSPLTLVLPLAAGLGLASLFSGSDGILATLPIGFLLAGAILLSASPDAPMKAASTYLSAAFLLGVVGLNQVNAVLAGLAILIALLAIAIDMRNPGGDTNTIAFLSFSVFVLALASGLTWAVAGFMAGYAYGKRTDTGNPRDAGAEVASRRAIEIFPFLAGYYLNTAKLPMSALATATVAATFMATAAARYLLGKGSGSASRADLSWKTYLPAHPSAFIAVVIAKQAGMIGDATITGIALAYAVSAFFSADAARGQKEDRNQCVALRPIVGISRYQSASGLLAFASSLGRNGEPIRTVCVAAPPGVAGTDSAMAEEALIRSVVAGTAIGIQVMPSIVVAASPADGLARASLERKADALVVGWGRNDKEARSESPLTHEALARSTSGLIVSVRKPEAFRDSKRLVIAIHSGAESVPGFRMAVSSALMAWGKPPSQIEAIVVGGPRREALAAAPELTTFRDIMQIDAWRELPSVIRGAAKTSFAIIAARPGSDSWNPGSERLSVIIEDSYPEASLAIFYIAETVGTSPQAESGSQSLTPSRRKDDGLRSPAPHTPFEPPPLFHAAAKAGRILPNMSETALVDAITTLATALFPTDKGSATRLSKEFSLIARREPIELEPGVLLLHAHTADLQMSSIAIGARPEGWPLAALKRPVTIVVILCSPAMASPASHLEALTQIARTFRNRELITLLNLENFLAKSE